MPSWPTINRQAHRGLRTWIRILLIGVPCLVSATPLCSQPLIPLSEVPSDLEAEEREQIGRLYSSDPVQRAYAAIHLGKIESRAAFPLLVSMLGDRTSLEWREPGQPLMERGRGTSVRSEVLKVISQFDSVQRLLSNCLEHPLADVRRFAAATITHNRLSHVRGKADTEGLREALYDPDPEVATAAGRSLIDLGARHVAPDFVEILETSDNYALRAEVAEALGSWRVQAARAGLVAALEDPAIIVRRNAIQALWVVGSPEDVPALVSALLRLDRRATYLTAIATHYREEHVPLLLDALEHYESPWRAYQFTRALFDDPNDKVEADLLLSGMSGSFLPAHGNAEAIREAVLQNLENRDPTLVFKALLRQLKEGPERRRYHAVQALSSFPKGIQAMAQLVGHEDRGNPTPIRKAIADLMDSELGAFWAEASKVSGPRLGVPLVSFLADFRTETSVRTLVSFLEHQPETAGRALDALTRLATDSGWKEVPVNHWTWEERLEQTPLW